MPARILVAYASRAGSTAEAAEAIGQVLRDRGVEVDVQSVKAVHGVWVGKPLPEAVRFAAAHRTASGRGLPTQTALPSTRAS